MNKISAFTIIKNAIKYQFPIVESINSLLPFVDEYIVNSGDHEDDTDKLLEVFKDNPKVKIFKNVWEGKDQGMAFFRNQTNLALDRCTGDWCFYLQADEAVIEEEVKYLCEFLQYHGDKVNNDAIAFPFNHFAGDYKHVFKTYEEGNDMYPTAIRLIRNGRGIRSVGDALAFSGIHSTALQTFCKIQHYGWARKPEVMLAKKNYTKEFYFNDPSFTQEQKVLEESKIKDWLSNPPVNEYTGRHPESMKKIINE